MLALFTFQEDAHVAFAARIGWYLESGQEFAALRFNFTRCPAVVVGLRVGRIVLKLCLKRPVKLVTSRRIDSQAIPAANQFHGATSLERAGATDLQVTAGLGLIVDLQFHRLGMVETQHGIAE